MTSSRKLLALALALSISGVAGADNLTTDDARGRMKESQPGDRNEVQETLAEAIEAYRAITNERKIPATIQNNAKCIAIFPDVVTAAIGVGGIHGDGVAFCKNTQGAQNTWSNPVFLNLNGGTLGVQAGVKSADVLLYISSDKAREGIEKGGFQLSGDLSAVAGTLDGTVVARPAGVVAYMRTEGVFAGAAVNGTNLSRDDEDQQAFYGRTPQSVFNEKIPAERQQQIEQLRALLPKS
jgi:lipid-binding SYLF domain-containing protein